MTMHEAAPDDWQIHVLEYARSHNQPIASLLFGAFDAGTINLPFAFVMVRGFGRTVLIDTGFMCEGHGTHMADRYGVREWISPLRLLAEIGVAHENITDIIVTHAHYDHIGAIEQFPAAHIYLQKNELLSWIEVMALPREFSFLTDIIDPADIHNALRAAEQHRLTLLNGDTENVLPGISVRLGVGHTFGQQFAIISTGDGAYVVSGDCVFTKTNLTGPRNDGTYLPLGAGIGSTLDQLKTMHRIREAVNGDLDRVITLHDFARWEKLTMVKEVDGFRIIKVK